MKKSLMPFSLVVFALIAVPSLADIHTAETPSYADVSKAVAAADAGDTVLVPPGSATWDKPLVIEKGLILKGAGMGKTIIKSNFTDGFAGIIKYKPDFDNNALFRVTGFTLDGNNMSHAIWLQHDTALQTTWIRIDHNRIFNADACVRVRGTIYGVVDNNIFSENAKKT
ncbi:MAG: hypothetical protein EHM12_09415, partial [Dehalococcoidia bacterium]